MTTVRYTTINGEVIAEKRNGVRRLYVPDPLGSTVALLDNTQTQVDTFSYWPYGEVCTSTGTTPPPFQFVGTKGYYAGSGSKAYVRTRYLDVPQGRWLTEDPIAYAGGTNLYLYANNNPVINMDYWGLQTSLGSNPEEPPKPPKPQWPPLPGFDWCYNIYTRTWYMCPKLQPPTSPPGDPRIPPPPGTLPPPLPPINPPGFFFPGGPKFRLPPIGGGSGNIGLGGNPGGGKQKTTIDCQIIYINRRIGIGVGVGPDERTRCCLFGHWAF